MKKKLMHILIVFLLTFFPACFGLAMAQDAPKSNPEQAQLGNSVKTPEKLGPPSPSHDFKIDSKNTSPQNSKKSTSMDFTGPFLKTIFAMLFVIALAIFLMRWLLPKIQGGRLKATGSLRIKDRIPLDQKKQVFVIEVEGRRLLVGASENFVGLICEISESNSHDPKAFQPDFSKN